MGAKTNVFMFRFSVDDLGGPETAIPTADGALGNHLGNKSQTEM